MKKYIYSLKRILLIGIASCMLISAKADLPFFPSDIAISPKGEIWMTEKGNKALSVFSADGKSRRASIPLNATPTGLTLKGPKAYVTTFDSKGQLLELDTESLSITATIPTGSGSCHPAFGPDGQYLYVCNQFSNTIDEIDPVSKSIRRSVKVLREPKSFVFSKDGQYLYVTNFLPAQRADLDVVAACVSVIKLATFEKVKDIQLANGSNALRGICITPDGKYVYVSHNLGRFTVPTSQLQQGWMNTSAFSIIDTDKQEYAGVIIVDDPDRGAAGIWSIACDPERIYITHSGTHEVSVIDHIAMREKFEAYPDKSKLDYDLNFLYGLRTRISLEGNGPRCMALNDKQVIIPTYFADVLNILDKGTLELTSVALNPNREESPEQKGERYFNDAKHCFQNWQSCNGCHPGDARTDGMNWDLMNDGIGNSKNCKSLLFSHETPRCMISGIRETAELAVRAGFRYIQFYEPDEEMSECVDAYLKALKPVPSPYLVDGQLSEKAEKGRKVFEKLKCGECHSGPYFTDMKMHVIGENVEFEQGWDTPTLREVWRTAPYLFNGAAATMEEVFTIYKHGIEKKVSSKDIEALVEYVNSL